MLIDKELTKKINLAICSGNEAEVMSLLGKDGVDIDAIDEHGRTALMHASINNRPGIVDLLVNSGANLEAIDAFRYNALKHAIACGAQSALVSLVKAGVKTDAVLLNHISRGIQGQNTVLCLVNAGANLNAVDDEGQTALTLAIKFAPQVIVESMVEAFVAELIGVADPAVV